MNFCVHEYTQVTKTKIATLSRNVITKRVQGIAYIRQIRNIISNIIRGK